MTRSEYSILGVTTIGHCLCHWSVLIVTGLLVTLQREFGLTEFWVTALPLTGYVLMGVGAVPAGIMADRWGPRRVLLVYFVLTGLACGAAAVAPNAWALAAALTALGAAVSLYHPTGLALISHGIRMRGQALGIHGVAGAIGLGGSSFGLWMASLGSWRAAYAIVAVVALAAGSALWWLPTRTEGRTTPAPPDVPRCRRCRHPLADVSGPRCPACGTPFDPADRPGAVGMDRRALRLLLLLYLAMMLSGFNYRSFMTALPTYLTARGPGHYAGEGHGGAVLAVFLIGGIGQFFGGRLADRRNAVRLYVALVALSIPLALLLAASAGIGPWAAVAAMGLAAAHFSTQPVENLLIARHTPARFRSTSYGIKFLVTFGLGALGAPVVGFLWRTTGTLAWTFVLFALVGLFVTAIVLGLVRAVGRHEAEPLASAPASSLKPAPGASGGRS